MGKKINQGWQIFKANRKLTIILFIIMLVFTAILYFDLPKKFFHRQPDTYIFIYGMENYLDMEKIMENSPNPTEVVIRHLKTPIGFEEVDDVWVPAFFGKWTNRPGKKEFIIIIENRGDGTDRNVRVFLASHCYSFNFSKPQVFDSVSIANKNRVSLIEGGVGSSFIAFNIKELAPGERQEVKVLTTFKNIDSVSAYSEIQGDINKVFISDIIYNVE